MSVLVGVVVAKVMVRGGVVVDGSIDLRAGAVYLLTGRCGLVGVEQRNTPTVVKADAVGDPPAWDISDGVYCLVETIEEVRLPLDVCAIVRPRSTIFRCGRVMTTGAVHPGYRGTLTFGLWSPPGTGQLVLEKGAHIATLLVLQRLSNDSSGYRGVWQGGRISTNGRYERGY